jgi:cellulose biosynthesis protein BcsQ
LQALVKSTNKERLSVIPSDPNLTLRDPGGSGHPALESRFMRDVLKLGATPLGSLGGTPDWIILDTAPAMIALTRAGLAAAQYVIAPVRPRRLSLRGTRNMLTTLRTINALTNSGARFLGMVITHWDDLKLSQEFEDLLLPPALQEFGGEAFTVKIPLDNRLEYEEPGVQTPGAKAYAAVAIEVLNAVKSPIVQ